ncbi:hypothetical protein [Natronorubrum bangense]|uniref:Uncharacterized protein n=2 Tax=Natronorubrum bangense TaxID=61858 RepID=L9WHU6_9EURY|nr:hypothetical protein [Natronorubrum bangense]ELY49070.1 hypothetical protein C494_09064 [Natronorubrum bangense JCM 10635]QCC56470.1 hypothetical protein DV706_18290 [Natronorubrum bangense]
MAGITDPRPPLPEWILECYDLLCSHADQLDNGKAAVRVIEHDDATDVLLSDSELALEQRDVEYALTRLLERGYFYEVEDELRVTSPEEPC